MATSAFEASVEQGLIRLPENVTLPEKTKVFVIVPDVEAASPKARIYSPHLARPEDSKDFTKLVVEESGDGGV